MTTTQNEEIAVYRSKYEAKKLSVKQSPKNIENIHPSEQDQKMANAAQTAWNNYTKTTEGQEMLSQMRNMTIEDIQRTIKTIYASRHFNNFRVSYSTASATDFKSFSIGVALSGSIIIGATISAGCIFDLSDATNVEGYVTAAGLLGVNADIGLAEEFGFWNCAYNQFSGASYGFIIAGEEFGGISFGAFFTDPTSISSFMGFSIGPAEGEGIEISACASYTWTVDPIDSLRPVAQLPKGHFMLLTKLVCSHTSDDGAGDEDEVYFTFCADQDITYYFPKTNYYSMRDSGDFSTWYCGRSVYFDQNVTIQLYDQDDSSGDDTIGAVTINMHDLPVNRIEKGFAMTKENGASYTIYAKLIY